MVMRIRQQRRQRKLSGHNAYFESLTPAAKTPISSTEKAPPQVAVPKKTSRRLSGASSYLDNLSKSPSSMTTRSQIKRGTTIVSKKKSDDAKKKKLDEKPSSKQERTIAPPGSKGATSYLESLSASTASSDSKKTKEEKVKAKQSDATSNNPFLEEVRTCMWSVFLKNLHIML